MPDDKKIIIDEDWKSQVQAEKEAAAKQEPAKPQAGAAGARPGDFAMPPASLEMLVTTLATEALMALGQVPHPQSGEPIFAPQQAKYLIDTIEVVNDKTKGNTTPQEAQLMEEILHQLRMVYV
ncbi:MAG: DUF1844 domain-containing protein, partial [Pirellulales bacterium]